MSFDFIQKRKFAYLISILVVLISLASLAFQGLNLGIDFTGGTVLQVAFENETDVAEVRQTLQDMNHDNAQIQAIDEGSFLIKTYYMDQADQDAFLADVSSRLSAADVVQGNTVGPSMGKEILNKGLIALTVAIVLMIAYITFRFEWRFALTGIIALFHDIIVTLGLFSLFQWEVNSAFIAAILTIFGYSINDTIVVFDRLRENLGSVKKDALAGSVNYSISSTLRRSLYTSISTLIPLTAVFALGGDTTKMFTLAMIIGIASGAYSSIFVAAPMWYDVAIRSKKKRF